MLVVIFVIVMSKQNRFLIFKIAMDRSNYHSMSKVVIAYRNNRKNGAPNMEHKNKSIRIKEHVSLQSIRRIVSLS